MQNNLFPSVNRALILLLVIWFWTFISLTRRVHLEERDLETYQERIKNQFQKIVEETKSSSYSASSHKNAAVATHWNDKTSLIQLSGVSNVIERYDDQWTWTNPLINTTIDDTSGQSFPPTLTSFQDLLKINTNIPIPENLHIAFAGDSLTRYQYISLVYYMRHGRWIDPKEIPNMTQEKQHATWHNFYKFTMNKLHPNEQCDCFRPEGHKMPLMNENRFYWDPIRNNSISFFQKFGHKFPFKSNWNYTDVNKPHELLTREDQVNPTIETNEWNEFISKFVANLNPKPTFFVYNEGIHPHRDFMNKKTMRQILRALRESGMIGVYKTTTKYKYHNITNNRIDETNLIRDYEMDFCKKSDLCADSSWSWKVPLDYYSDYAHFHEPVYSWMNVQLLDLLKVKKTDFNLIRQRYHHMEAQVDLSFASLNKVIVKKL